MENDKKTRILFISHTYPPITGGVERQNFDLYTWLSKVADVKLIANKKRWLIPLFLPYAALRAVFGRYDALLLGSCILGNAGWLAKIITKRPVIAVAHGLDLTWKNKIYQKLWVRIFLKKIDKFIAVGNETARVAVEKGIAAEKVVFIPNGIDLQKYSANADKNELEKIIGQKLDGKKTILTSGRLAKRKGAAWFVANVMPKLPENIIYIIAGDGPDRENIQDAIAKNNLGHRVIMLGFVTDPVRDMLFHTCDLFVQPNIKVPGDMEGFGISVIEAAFCGIPVVASALEGLKDAIKDGQDGFLVESGNAESYAAKVDELLADNNYRKEFGEKARQFVIDNYSWENISQRYLEEIGKII